MDFLYSIKDYIFFLFSKQEKRPNNDYFSSDIEWYKYLSKSEIRNDLLSIRIANMV